MHEGFAPQDPLYRDEFIRDLEREVTYQADCSHTNIADRISIILKARPLVRYGFLPKATL